MDVSVLDNNFVFSEVFCFTKKADSNKTFTWRFSSRPSRDPCKSIVRQKKHHNRDCFIDYDQDDFVEIPHDSDSKHNHAADYGNHHRVPIFTEAKKIAVKEKFTAPREIIYGEIKKKKSITGRDMPHIDNGTRRLRYLRAKIQPANPRKDEPFFDVKEDFFPENFYQGPIYAGTGASLTRHLLFFTPVMKRQEDCRIWFLDSTFYFMNDPFKQLLSFNGFIKNSKGHLKQIPLLFCCMTRRRAIDYSAVFQKIKEIVPFLESKGLSPTLKGLFSLLSENIFLPAPTSAAIFTGAKPSSRRSVTLNLRQHTTKKAPIQFAILYSSYSALPIFLIVSVFDSLRNEAPPELEELLEYMDRNWIRGKFWTPENWSCYNILSRTNNDCEGLHHQWNKLAGGSNLPFYKMTMVLEKLSDEVAITSELLCHDKIRQHRKKVTELKDSILFSLWARYQKNELNTMELLEEIVRELKSTFPSHVAENPFNIDIDELDMSVEEEV
uniref:MULE transposase domain-containing protein n=1 Tax=Daphnia galeata TaxID=27404 RepID=A0A8J2WFF3_9CRUS|nr:unnamed protein product [Daphnia galeata]